MTNDKDSATAGRVRKPEEIAEDYLPSDAPKNISAMVKHLEEKGWPHLGSRAAHTLEAMFWIGKARAYGWEWDADGARPVKDEEGTIPSHVKLPAWVVEEVAAVWVGFSRERSWETLDEGFGVTGLPRHLAELRLTALHRFERGWQVQDLKDRTGMKDTAARSVVADHTKRNERTIADDHRMVREYLRQQVPAKPGDAG